MIEINTPSDSAKINLALRQDRHVRLGPGDFPVVDSVVVPSETTLEAASNATRLVASKETSITDPLVKIPDGANNVTLKGFEIMGMKGLGVKRVGILSVQDNLTRDRPDSEHRIIDMTVNYCGAEPIILKGKENRGGWLTRFRAFNNAEAVVLDAADWMVTGMHVGSADKIGVKVYRQMQISDSKCFYSDGHGWLIDHPRVQLANCNAQDNEGHGFWFTRKSGFSTAVGCQADSNGFNSKGLEGFGFYIQHRDAQVSPESNIAFDKNEGKRGLYQKKGFVYEF